MILMDLQAGLQTQTLYLMRKKSIYFRKQDDSYIRTGFASQVRLSCN